MSNAKAFDRSAPQQSEDGWLQTTPGERFKIRIRAEETQAAYTMLEMVADPRNGVPMHIHKNEDEHFIVLEGTLHTANGDKRLDAPAGTSVTVFASVVSVASASAPRASLTPTTISARLQSS